MKKDVNPNIPKWLYPFNRDEISGKFVMIPYELYESPIYEKLSHNARDLYIAINTFRNTDTQRNILFNALTEYNQILCLGMTEQDIKLQAYPQPKHKGDLGYFVAPEKYFIGHGFSSTRFSDGKRELMEHGFFTAKFGGQGRYNGWNKNVTVFRFSSSWH